MDGDGVLLAHKHHCGQPRGQGIAERIALMSGEGALPNVQENVDTLTWRRNPSLNPVPLQLGLARYILQQWAWT